MDTVDAPRRASYGLSVLVAMGWYVTVTAAMVVGLSGVPEAPKTDCSAMFSCLSPLEGFGVLVAFGGGPILLGLLVSTLLLTGLLARLVPSSIVAGTTSALSTLVIGGVLWLAWVGTR